MGLLESNDNATRHTAPLSHTRAGSTAPANSISQLGNVSRRLFICGLVVATTSGCQNLVKRGQSPDTNIVADTAETVVAKTKYIASICKMAGLRGEKIEGIALVTQLKSTGSAAKPGEIRRRLERALERMDLDVDTADLIKSKDSEIVLCRSFLPPGVRKGDRIDIEVQALRDTDATSLENGFAIHTRLHDTAKLGNTVKEGHLKAVATGRVLTNATFANGEDETGKLKGVILGGGRSNMDRNLSLLMRKGSGSVRTATQISAALNRRFTISTGGGLKNVAEAKTDQVVALKIPDQYRHSVGRYAQVVSNLAFAEDAQALVNRLDVLERQMNDPISAGLAAVRLEGIGRQAVPTLIRSLQNRQLPIRFYAAQALAYLGKDDGVSVLQEAAIAEAAFRWQALTALASLDNGQSEQTLMGLLSARDDQTRCGAFRALRLQNPSHPAVESQWLANDHHLSIIDNESEPLLHFAGKERAEILIFNNSQTFSDKFLYVESGLTVKSNGDGTVSVASYKADNTAKTVCSDRVSDVFQTIAQAGHGYAALLRLARHAMQEGTLNSRLAIDAMPKVGRQYKPKIAKSESNVVEDDRVQQASWWSSVKEKFAR